MNSANVPVTGKILIRWGQVGP